MDILLPVIPSKLLFYKNCLLSYLLHSFPVHTATFNPPKLNSSIQRCCNTLYTPLLPMLLPVIKFTLLFFTYFPLLYLLHSSSAYIVSCYTLHTLCLGSTIPVITSTLLSHTYCWRSYTLHTTPADTAIFHAFCSPLMYLLLMSYHLLSSPAAYFLLNSFFKHFSHYQPCPFWNGHIFASITKRNI